MKVRLSDLYDIGSSKRVFQSEWRESGVPFYRAREIAKLSTDGYVDNELFIDEDLYSEYVDKYGKPEAGDVMVTGVGTLGVCYVVKPEDRFYFKDGNILWFKQKAKDRILPEYLVKAFESKEVKEFIDKNSSGTTVGTFTIQTAKKMEISLPSIEEQVSIIQKVTKIESIIRQRRQELLLLDELIKARFVEMFGMPGTDKFGWGLVQLGSVCCINPKKVQDNRLASGVQVSFVPMPAVTERGGIDATAIKEYDEVKTGFTYFAENDVLFAKITPCMENGKGAVARGLHNGIGFGSTEFHVLRPTSGKTNPYWIYTLTAFSQFREDAASNMTGSAGQRRVPASFLEHYQVAVPPIELQERFAIFVEQTDKSKVEVQKALDEVQLLFDSLMQEYFG